ncbi:MazG nucleotide pyrophosphohydrolase domain-containing protein [Thermococcus sp. JdF3]|uniref:MazG nucleotide pyrophosphohydrolase domain-containing protein n=1 Tax=Thermococcus sp. JdF3 TaxID=1638258 RepID=UPI00143BB801|nr:MazG nucleotide pyrophosphohydrolase domain-containing protein [Thermococcus sp. JdF3]NJE00865.1 nucleotide pyrophosphohydrolase [Thermococcus sp. JdF3]
MEIREFQEMIKEIYFHKDSKRGVERTFLWFVEEVGELSEAIRKNDREAMEEEFADVLAWLASLATLLGVDLEEAAKKKYPGVCPYCGKKPCECEEK